MINDITITKIFNELKGISYSDLSTAEKNILKIIGKHNYLMNLLKLEREN